MGRIADHVRTMRGCSLSQIVEAIAKMEAETLDVGADGFEQFWKAWPNKVGKRAAEKAFKAARRRRNSAEDILAGVARYVATKPPDRPWLNPATFLSQDRFNDDPAPVQRKLVGAEHFFAAAERMRNEREYREANSGDRWNADGFPVLSLEHKGRDG